MRCTKLHLRFIDIVGRSFKRVDWNTYKRGTRTTNFRSRATRAWPQSTYQVFFLSILSRNASARSSNRKNFHVQPGLVYLRFLCLLKIVRERFIAIERHRDTLLQVSWVRHRDIHLLTVGRYTYTSDQRFEALHLPHAEEWTLRIRYPQQKDSGIYECQISTTPPIGHPVYLTIVGKLEKTRFSLRATANFDL